MRRAARKRRRKPTFMNPTLSNVFCENTTAYFVPSNSALYDLLKLGAGMLDSDSLLQGGAGGLAVGWVDLDLECSTILLGQ